MRVSTTSPWRLSIKACGSVVDSWVALLRFSPRRSAPVLVEQKPHLSGHRSQANVLGADQGDRVANARVDILDGQVGVVVANDLVEGDVSSTSSRTSCTAMRVPATHGLPK